jgi:DNA helicase IV
LLWSRSYWYAPFVTPLPSSDTRRLAPLCGGKAEPASPVSDPVKGADGQTGTVIDADAEAGGVPDTERAAVQAYLDCAYALLGAMEQRTGAAERDAAARAAGDWDATMAQRHLQRRLESLRDDSSPLCFGSIDEAAGPRWHIGRRHVEDDAGDPVVIDWRAPAAVPFYRATYADPFGLDKRRRFLLEGRHVLDLLEEDFGSPEAHGAAVTGGLPDPLLATLGHSRQGTMRDIVATIAAEQDRIIRAPIDRPVIVQGGPGTGKTAVGLHRAAFLLYEHRRALERQGVLVIGPNRLFLTYISEVLPSLGEVAVTQTTLEGLLPSWPVRGSEPAAAAALKGEARMAEALAAVCDGLIRAPSDDLAVTTRWGSVTLRAGDVAALLEQARGSGGPAADRRARFRRSVADTVGRRMDERRGEVLDRSQIVVDLNADRTATSALDRMWPTSSPAALVRRLFSRSSPAPGPLGADELALLSRRPARSLRDEPWTAADLPLLDEAAALVGGNPRVYGHVVVDEAQDLSPMALRMVRRRSRDGLSFTVLGDLAQATAPGATADWGRAIAALGDPAGATVESLTVGYRVPAPIMDVANAYLAATAPHLDPTRSVRADGEAPRVVRADGEVTLALATVVRDLLATFQTVAVISAATRLEGLVERLRQEQIPVGPAGAAPRPGHLTLVRAEDAKGLEFDAVVVLEPAAFLDIAGGAGLLYIAMTRAVQQLTVMHALALPAGFPLAP